MKVIGFAGVPGAGKDTAAQYLVSAYPNAKLLKLAHPLQDITAILGGFYDPEHMLHRNLYESSNWKNNPTIDVSVFKDNKEARHLILEQIVKVMVNVPYTSDVDITGEHLSTNEGIFFGDWLYDFFHYHLDAHFPEQYYSPREIMKRIGTDLVREMLASDTWIAILGDKLANLPEYTLALVSDVRFLNEANLVQKDFNGKLVYIDNDVAYQKAQGQGLLVHASETDGEELRRRANYRITNPMSQMGAYFEEVQRMYDTFQLEDNA